MEENRILHLSYAFIPTPNPIRASLPKSDPNRIDLQVVISNPSIDEFTFKLIQIEIPVGEDIAADLSTEPKLPDPGYDTSGKWKIAIDPTQTDMIRVSPKNTGEAITSDAIIFTISGIKINTKPGTVAITVAEDDTVDSDTYSLVKQPSDFPVTKFWVNPAILYELDLTSKLYWTCDPDLGPKYTYNLREIDGSWKLEKLQWNAGTGIQTPSLIQTYTKFALDVVKADSSGHLTVIGTVVVSVLVDDPKIIKPYMEINPSIRFYRLHWLTSNVTSCDLLLDEKPFLNNLPLDTYHEGYPVYVNGDGDYHHFTLVAYGQSKDIKDYYPFPEFKTKATKYLSTPGFYYSGFAVTHDGKLALLTPYYGDTRLIAVIDIPGGSVLGSIPVRDLCGGIKPAITFDDQLAFALGFHEFAIINIPKRSVEATFPCQPHCIAITPDDRYALLVVGYNNPISVFNIPKRCFESWSIQVENPIKIQITPDGKFALATLNQLHQVAIIDMNSPTSKPAIISLGSDPMEMAITPDGTLALFLCINSQAITVLNITTRLVEASIPLPYAPADITISNNGKYALVSHHILNPFGISVIDIARRSTVISFSRAFGQPKIAVTPDNTILIEGGDAQSKEDLFCIFY